MSGVARLVCAVWLIACSSVFAGPEQPEAASGFAPRAAQQGQQAMVVTANPHATRAALKALEAGGNALDAAIVAALMLNVVEPQSSGIGGGGFMLHRQAGERRPSAWDGRERAPAAVDERWFLDEQGEPMAFFDAVVSGRSVGVPGLLRMFEQAHARHGRLGWAQLFAPAIATAEQGFEVSPRLHALLARDRFLADDAEARALFYDEAGEALAVGARLRNPELADSLRLIAAQGADAFYEGELAADIVAAVARAPRPGAMTRADMHEYRAVRREPVCGRYRDHRVCGMPPPSAGGGTVLAMLGMLERFPLPDLAPDSAFVAHLFSEAGRLAYADRDAWYGNPSHMRYPVQALIAPDYLQRRAARIELDESLGRAPAGRPDQLGAAVDAEAAPLRSGTSHMSVVDRHGNAVALTASIENAFGARRMVRGFLLNNQLTDFAFVPDQRDGEPHPNRPGAGKRPLSAMAPTMIFNGADALHAITGSPGGSRIINYVAASVVGLLDWKLAPDAMLARVHVGSRNDATEVEDRPAGRALSQALQAFGHDTVLRDMTSGLGVIVRDGRGWLGAADPRREGTAAGF